jgi:hypothetical protein
MPVQMQVKINRGWKASENNRFGQVLEIQFINVSDGRLMFAYAPTLKDEIFWVETFKKLRTFDAKHKDLMNWLALEVDGTISFGKGDCYKEDAK